MYICIGNHLLLLYDSNEVLPAVPELYYILFNYLMKAGTDLD